MLGANGAGSYTALRDGFSSVGGSNLQSGPQGLYWSSTEYSSYEKWCYVFDDGHWGYNQQSNKCWARACLAFGALKTVTLNHSANNTWAIAEMPYFDVELEVEYYDEVTLTDGEAITGLDTYKGQEIWVNYTRSFTEGKTSTVCLPFAYTKKEGDGSFYAFTNIEKVGNDYVATMTEPAATTLTANTPYLYLPNATGDVDFGGAYTIPATLTAGSTTSNGWTFKGTFETIEWKEAPTGTYGFSAQSADGISQGQFVQVGDYVRIKPMRCYLENESFAGARGTNRAAEQLPETIKVRLIGADGTVTAIGTLYTRTGEVSFDSEAWYTLDGKRLNAKPNTKGIYVNNGKKVIIK
jgi:hypothetical protein